MWQAIVVNGKKVSIRHLQHCFADLLKQEVMVANVHLLMIATGFLAGSGVGYLMHRSDYCMAGMFRDLFLFRTAVMFKTFLLFLVVSLPLFELIRLSGLVLFPFPKYGPPSGSNLLGGFLFGVGMVLAGGCAVGTLYKMGAGSFSSLLAFIGMIIGSILFAVLYPHLLLLDKALVLPTRAVTLPDLLQIPSWLAVLVLLLIMTPVIHRWFRRGDLQKATVVEGYLQPWKAAIGLALLAVSFLLVMGLPMGVTTSNAKFGAILLQLVVPEQYATLAFFQRNSFEYLPPLGGGLVIGGAGAALDGIALVQFPLIIGIIIGSAWSAIRLEEWHLHCKLPWRQVCSAILGGIIMGLASRMAPSCNLWHLYGGLPILGLQSILFLVGMLPGSWLGAVLLSRLVMPARVREGI